MIAMHDTRFAFLGDIAIDPSSRADLHQEAVCLDTTHPLTNYCTGRLDGWVRVFTREGFFLSNQDLTLPPAQRPTGPVPTVQEWAAFDFEARHRGAAGYTDMLKKKATPSTDFASVLSRALSKFGESLASFDLGEAFKGGALTLKAVTDELDKFVPGSGGIVGNIILNALGSVIPFMPLLTSTLSTIAGNVPLAGGVLGPLVRTFGTAGQSFIAPTNLTGVSFETALPQTTFDIATQQQVNNALLESLSSFAKTAATDLAPLKYTLVRLVSAYQSTHGSLVAKLAATAEEALKELMFAATIACAIGSLGTLAAECALITSSITAALAIDRAVEQSEAIKSAAKQAKASAAQQVTALDREAAALQAEIARLEAENARNASNQRSGLEVAAGLAAALLIGRALA